MSVKAFLEIKRGEATKLRFLRQKPQDAAQYLKE